jgi:hypothetical protein
MVLIEKEWLTFGFPFAQRLGHGLTGKKGEMEQQSPVFIQFIDSVWQVWRQYPSSFEFNEELLFFILRHAYSW